MRRSKWALGLLATLLALGTASTFSSATTPASGVTEVRGAICPAPIQPGGAAGVIPTKLTIMHDAWLACDVQCLQIDHQACIEFGRPNIKLSLNGFKMTGPANVPSRDGCSRVVTDDQGVTFDQFLLEADGIHSKFDEVQIVGPGVVQRMRRHGISLGGVPIPPGVPGVPPRGATPVTKAQVKKVTSHMNCFSGVFLFMTSGTLIDEVVSVKNSASGGARPCGGICVTNSSRNIIRRSEVAGNGTADGGAPVSAPGSRGRGNDFGIGLVGNSDFNLIEENGVGGNINGLALFPFGVPAGFPENNLIKRNIFAGNPPTEAHDLYGPDAGSDVRDFVGAAGNNRFEQNLCLTYTFGGAGVTPVTPVPCIGAEHEPARQLDPKVPQFAGHQNN
jgi:Right handed beta helix region